MQFSNLCPNNGLHIFIVVSKLNVKMLTFIEVQKKSGYSNVCFTTMYFLYFSTGRKKLEFYLELFNNVSKKLRKY